MSIFAVQHSGMARRAFKSFFARFFSPAVERSTFVLLASLSSILLFWQWQPLPTIVWSIDGPVFAGAVAAGGGIELDGTNYLIPTDAAQETDSGTRP
ncbi:hypothetical protein ML401_23330 [Bradyrhizobium sp. 62B]|uniref:hypothetical protein n=1 Tax=Bradyrhizobium sp. 62B TaxID=2898442 RepID=UPI0025583336|nr:hypothetical protein ML401_23330 [Bradyrhizobium sp. 62B]